MTQPQSDWTRNRLLRALAPEDLDRLRPHLHPLATELRQPLFRPGETIRHLYFPLSGFSSVTTRDAEGRIEVGMIGNEGLVGAGPVLLGAEASPLDHFVQTPGTMLRIGRDALLEDVAESPALHRLLLRYVQTFTTQTAYTAFVNATYTIEVRLARWLLMCQDRVEDDEIVVTHDFLSMMLGVQRSGVTVAIQVLEGNGLIRARRGRILVLERERLKEVADDGYGVPEAEYAHLIEGG